jgi:hypothetical protein
MNSPTNMDRTARQASNAAAAFAAGRPAVLSGEW